MALAAAIDYDYRLNQKGVFHLSRSAVKLPEGVGDKVLNGWQRELVQGEP